ncbi:Retrotransposon Polyprotein [Phytophthora megakarya]|uniref:Retrotransposon Polyprotein n=1 Tax=Phytophthora megakarya TaxID=4795 RepID=A0A225W0U4_9STRA|nr:Retrotransposon Polyprotein [Phytophthora megakarya]
MECTEELRNHFECLKTKISFTPVLASPIFDRPFHLPMDASDFTIGRVLFQEDDEGQAYVERPAAFGRRKFKDAERNYSIREKELLVTLFGLRLFRYIPGKENVVTDGLSHRPDSNDKEPITLASLSTRSKVQQRVKHDIVHLVKEAVCRYAEDLFTANLQQCLSAKEHTVRYQTRNLERYNIDNKQIFYQNQSDEHSRLVLPNIPELIDGILYEFHDGKCYGHPAVERTLRLVEKNYYWRYMQRSIWEYVQSCEVCQRSKGRNTKPPGLPRSRPIPSTRWTHLAANIVVALPETKAGYDAVMVVIDRLTKRSHFLPTTTIATALKTATLYRDRLVSLHGLPEELLSDRDSKFTSAVWMYLCEMLGTHQKLTAAFRQQANGVTERVNQTMESYLHTFNNINSDDGMNS